MSNTTTKTSPHSGETTKPIQKEGDIQHNESKSAEHRLSRAKSDGTTKSHKIEGKNKKSLHHKKEQQRQVTLSKHRANQSKSESSEVENKQTSSSTPFNGSCNNQKESSTTKQLRITTPSSTGTICSSPDEFSSRAQELKSDIKKALEKQLAHQIIDRPLELMKLKSDIIKLSNMRNGENILNAQTPSQTFEEPAIQITDDSDSQAQYQSNPGCTNLAEINSELCVSVGNISKDKIQNPEDCVASLVNNEAEDVCTKSIVENGDSSLGCSEDSVANTAPNEPSVATKNLAKAVKSSSSKKRGTTLTDTEGVQPVDDCPVPKSASSNDFMPLNSRLDSDSKVIALMSSLQKQYNNEPQLLEPVCRKIVDLSEQNEQLISDCERFQTENRKLLMVKQKLESLCRELQKSHNSIRTESLDLIKVEQGKAKEQTTKIQSTLSGVIKLFDENQQRNMNLRQENQELQTKLKSLLDHCDSWEKSVEAALRQRDIENRLLKTELAKANLLKNEEKEKFLGEKQELLQILSMMQEQQHRIEGQEAKLRSDLSNYASKYDECQAVISQGMNRFQVESKKMLKQIEKSKQDYRVLLTKYEINNKRMAQLLEEKQYWNKSMSLANKKVETLEKLCRALRERKLDGGNNTQTDS